jgi:hypothetical protein
VRGWVAPVVDEAGITQHINPPGVAATMQLYAHPFSSYCQKVLIALYENNIPFEWRQLGPR